jgi:hypothetical protein
MLVNSADLAGVIEVSLALIRCCVTNREYHQPNQPILQNCLSDQLNC